MLLCQRIITPIYRCKTLRAERGVFYFALKEVVRHVAKGKYEKWLEPDGLLLLEGWAREGLTDEQLAKNMGISARTLYTWKNNHLQIMQALKKGKDVADFEVENALFKRAIGYRYTEVTTEYDGETVKTKETIKEVVPDTTAQIFWLKNRKPNKWRDKPVDESNVSDELRKIADVIRGEATDALHGETS